jgi:Putative transposase/Transposase zinc-binding domain
MPADHRTHKNRFKQIFADGWEDFKRNHPRYEAVDEVVRKMLGCGDPANGYAVYLCPDCQERRVVAFSCKSQFCLSCAKVYGQQWVETVQAMLHPGVIYRHLTLTVPEALRTLFYQHPATLLSGLMQAAQAAMDAVVSHAKRQTVKLGYIMVLQTAGRSATYNPHLHVIMTDGGLRADGTWQRLGYLPHDLLDRTWQAHVLQMIATRLAEDEQAQRLVAEIWRNSRQGFVAYLQADVRRRMQQLARYLAKYVISPAMALSRIVGYDREHSMVTYWYRDHQRGGQRTEETVSRETFIGRMVQHILPKGFQPIRYYGLQATCILKQVREQLALVLHTAVQQAMDMLEMPGKRARDRERMLSTLGRDPLRCPGCGGDMWLWQIWHPQYGVIYDELERMKVGVYERAFRPVCRPTESDRAGDAGSGPDGHVQLPLFALPACR